MPSRTSFFSAKVYKHTLLRYWILIPVYAAGWIYQLLRSLSGYRGNWASSMDGLIRAVIQGLTSPLPMAGAVIVAMVVYGWLYQTRAAAFTTALPVRRETVFVSNMAAGITLLLGGNVLAMVLTAVLGAGSGNLFPALLLWLAMTSLLCVGYFGFATLCATLTGSIVILPVVYTVLLYSAVALEATLRRIAQFLIFGLSGQRWKLTVLSPAYHLRVNYGAAVFYDWVPASNGEIASIHITCWGLLGCYAAAGLIFAALSVPIIRRRRMEAAGDVVAVPGLGRIFPLCGAGAVSLSAGLMTLQMIFGYSGYDSPGGSTGQVVLLLVMMLLGGFIGWFGSQGLMRKTVRVFDRGWVGFGIFCAVVCALVLGTDAGLLGVENHLPDIEDVAMAQVRCNYASVYATDFTQRSNIADVMQLQRDVIANKKLYESSGSYAGFSGGALEIRYYDGSGELLLARSYAAPAGEYAWTSKGNSSVSDIWGRSNPLLWRVEELVNRREAVEQRLIPDFPLSAAGVEFGHVTYVRDDYVSNSLTLTQAEAMDLYINCVIPDMEDSSIGYLHLTPGDDALTALVQIRISFVYRESLNASPRWHYVDLYGVPEEAYRTRTWLEDHGVYIIGPPTGEAAPGEESVLWNAAVDEDPLEGLGLVLEKVYSEYDADAAGTVVSMRWARMLLDAYAEAGEDQFLAYDQVRKFAQRHDVTAYAFSVTLERLRTAGDQLAEGGLGLVRDGGQPYTAEMVADMFEAIYAGTGLTP